MTDQRSTRQSRAALQAHRVPAAGVGVPDRRGRRRLMGSVPSARRRAAAIAAALQIAASTVLAAGCADTRHVSPDVRALDTATDSDLPVGAGPGNYVVAAQPPPGTCHYRYTPGGQPLPDPSCTPGAINPKVTQENIGTTICKPGYSKSIRPSRKITDIEKRLNAQSYGYTGDLADAEFDHLIAISAGGDPHDVRNLWLEPPSPGHRPKDGPNNDKDRVEQTIHTLICSGHISLRDAQVAMAHDWTTASPTGRR